MEIDDAFEKKRKKTSRTSCSHSLAVFKKDKEKKNTRDKNTGGKLETKDNQEKKSES